MESLLIPFVAKVFIEAFIYIEIFYASGANISCRRKPFTERHLKCSVQGLDTKAGRHHPLYISISHSTCVLAGGRSVSQIQNWDTLEIL